MTVSELIAKLEKFPLDARVVTPGFDENGLDDVVAPVLVFVVFHDDLPSGHYGPHKFAEDEPDGMGISSALINFGPLCD